MYPGLIVGCVLSGIYMNHGKQRVRSCYLKMNNDNARGCRYCRAGSEYYHEVTYLKCPDPDLAGTDLFKLHSPNFY